MTSSFSVGSFPFVWIYDDSFLFDWIDDVCPMKPSTRHVSTMSDAEVVDATADPQKLYFFHYDRKNMKDEMGIVNGSEKMHRGRQDHI